MTDEVKQPTQQSTNPDPAPIYPRIEPAEDLERIVGEQSAVINAMKQAVAAMHQKVTPITAPIDVHHSLFERHGWAAPRPMPKNVH